MAQIQQDLNHLNALSHLRVVGAKALERRYNDLRQRYSKLNVSTKYTASPALFEHALRCGVELANNPAATLPHTLVRFGAKIMFSRRFLHMGLIGNARKALRQADRRVKEARALFQELHVSLKKLEMAQRATVVHRRWSVVFNRLLRLDALYAEIREASECIEDPVREEASIDAKLMRLCIAEFESPNREITKFQKQQDMIAAALYTVHQKVTETDFDDIEVMLADAEQCCNNLEVYLADLRSAVEEYEAIEEQILQWRRTNGRVGGIDHSEDSATHSTALDSGFESRSTSHSSESGVQFSIDVDGSHGRGDAPVCNLAMSDAPTLQQDAASECDTELEVTSREEVEHPMATPMPRVALGGCGNKRRRRMR
jgi:hypothetical protein